MALSSISSIGGVYGLSGSGMDVDTIVKNLMKAQQARIDALTQKKTLAEWKKTAYNDIYRSINDFRNTIFNYRLESTLSPNVVTSSNPSVATATVAADSPAISHSLIVGQLAAGVSLTSTGPITPATSTDKTTLAKQFGIAHDFTLNINSGEAAAALEIAATDSIYDVVSKINQAGIGVTASYDSALDRFFMATTNIGADSRISVFTSSTNVDNEDDGKKFINALQMFGPPTADSFEFTGDDGNKVFRTAYTAVSGTDAVFKLDGVVLTKNSNAFSIFGVNYNLFNVSDGVTLVPPVPPADPLLDPPGSYDIIGGTATTISVTKDVQGAVDNIQKLVDTYNELLATLNGKLAETRYKDYLPLTDTQKADLNMTDSETLMWTAKAQSGLLRNDSTITALVTAMRNAISYPVNGAKGIYNTAASIGITTGAYQEGGKLYLDTTRLTNALTADPGVLNELFSLDDGDTQKGIATRMYEGLASMMTRIESIAGTPATATADLKSSLALTITSYTDRITQATTRFSTLQTQYYTRFNAMEVALQSLSAQSSWISSLFVTE